MSEENFPISEEIKRQQQAQKRRRTRFVHSDEILQQTFAVSFWEKKIPVLQWIVGILKPIVWETVVYILIQSILYKSIYP